MATARKAPAAKAAATKPPKVEHCRIVERDGRLHASVPIFAYRVLFADGSVVNVEAAQDGSYMREALLTYRKVPDDRIEGIARLGCVGWTMEGEP